MFSNQHTASQDSDSWLDELGPELKPYIQIGYNHGIGEAICAVYVAATKHNLTFSPYTNTKNIPILGIVSRNTEKQLILFRIQLRPHNGKIRIYAQIDSIATVMKTPRSLLRGIKTQNP